MSEKKYVINLNSLLKQKYIEKCQDTLFWLLISVKSQFCSTIIALLCFTNDQLCNEVSSQVRRNLVDNRKKESFRTRLMELINRTCHILSQTFSL